MDEKRLTYYKVYTAPDDISSLEPNEVFVFGSNQAGRHGKGAAKTALNWGAVYGQAEGLQGQTYAIPTKDKYVNKTLSLKKIKVYVDTFIEFAKNHPDKDFLVTEIGCGLAGLDVADVSLLFKETLKVENIHLPKRFILSIVKKIPKIEGYNHLESFYLEDLTHDKFYTYDPSVSEDMYVIIKDKKKLKTLHQHLEPYSRLTENTIRKFLSEMIDLETSRGIDSETNEGGGWIFRPRIIKN